MYKLFRNVLQECTDFSSLYCVRIFGLYLLMLYLEFFWSNAVFFIFRTNVNFNNAHTKLYILFSPIIDAAHKMHLSSTYFLVLAYTHVIKEVCVEIGSTFIHFVTRWRFEAKLLLENLLLFSFYTPCLLFTIVLDNKFVLWTLLL